MTSRKSTTTFSTTALLGTITHSRLNWLLIFAPVSWVLSLMAPSSIWVFATAAIALVPAAGLIGQATEELAGRAGPTLGGLLNATFGNAAELIIGTIGLRANHVGVVKASITGSIIGNLLLVFGLACFVGGLRHPSQRFDRRAAGAATVMLFLAVIALIMPAVVDLAIFGSLKAHPALIDRLSVGSALVLIGVYGAGLIFAFGTHHDPLRPVQEPHVASFGTGTAIALLTLATLLTTVEAEILIGALEPALRSLGMTELFAGVVVIAIVGNAAEHYSAVTAAAADHMSLAFEIAVGSSAQIALLVAPALVLLSYAFGQPMSLVFNPFELAAIGLSVMAIALVAMDGESNWFEGLQLMAAYAILALAFYLIPE